MSEFDWRKISVLIADGVSIAAGDRVSVFVTDMTVVEPVEAFVDEAWRRGATVQVVATDERFDASALRWAGVEQLRVPPAIEVAAMEWSNVHVSFRAMSSPVLEADADHIAALRAARGIVSTMRWQGTRWALVRVPTAQWAEEMGLNAEDLVKEWAASFDEDWPTADERLGALCADLAGAQTAYIEDAFGTLELDIRDRVWIPFAGKANWPDGEIATAPVESRVNGTIAFPGTFSFAGVLIADLALEFREGDVVAVDAATGVDFVRTLLETDSGAKRLGELGIGVNRAVRTMTGDLLIDEKILGTVHIALGRAYPECGGVNESHVHWDIVKDLRPRQGYLGGSLRLDDTWLIREGVTQEILTRAAVGGRN